MPDGSEGLINVTHPRIQLIHAVPAARDPIHDAFRRLWPEARTVDLTDASLAPDVARAGKLTDGFTERMAALIRHGADRGADAVLFTCSAFGAAIDEARQDFSMPVLKPDEAMIADALSKGARIGGLATFEPTIDSLTRELDAAAGARGLAPEIDIRHVPGALDALAGGRGDEHDALITAAAAGMTGCDVLMLAQFSMARARDAIAEEPGRPVLAAPDAAVLKLKELLAA